MRTSEISRKTEETDITASLCLDGGAADVKTGVGFFDHMLLSFAKHSGFGLRLDAAGDLYVDAHHTVEDCGIVLGRALKQAIGPGEGIRRFASAHVPMDEALAFCAVDIAGRAFLRFEADFPQQVIGGYDACLTEEFFRAFAVNAEITLHIKAEYGSNSHHITEAMFKALAIALREAAAVVGQGIPSTKGIL